MEKYNTLKSLAMKKDWLEIMPGVFRDSKQRTIRKESYDNKEYYQVFSFDDGERRFDTLDELAEFYNHQ